MLGELSTTRRVRLHARIGAALEQRNGERPERAAEIAFHYGEAASMSEEHAAKAVQYLVAAAEHAESQFAWGEAARLYGNVLAIADDDPEALREHDPPWLQMALARSAQFAGDYRTAWRAIRVAAAAFEERSDAEGYVAIAATVAGQGIWYPIREMAELLQRGLVLAGDDPGPAIPILSALISGSFRGVVTDRLREDYASRLRALVAATPNPDAEFFLSQMYTVDDLLAGHLSPALDRLRQTYSLANTSYFARSLNNALFQWPLMMAGKVSEASDLYRIQLRAATTRNDQFMRENAAAYLSSTLLLRGRIGEYAQLDEQERASASYVWAGNRCHWAIACGDTSAALAFLPSLGPLRRIPTQRLDARALGASVLWYAGRFDDARNEWRLGENEATNDAPELLQLHASLIGMGWLVGYLDEAGPELVEEEQAEKIRANFRPGGPWAEDFILVPNPPICMLRLGAHWLVTGGEIEAGKARYQRSQAWCQAEGLPLEEGRSWLGLAQVAEIESDTARALECLDRAEPIFEGLGARYFAGRVRDQRTRLT